MTFALRPYQRAALDATYAYWSGGGGNPLIVLPTGAGKSAVIAMLLIELLRQFPAIRIAVITHTQELIRQNYLELLKLWPAAPAGIYSAGLGRRDEHARILFCGVQSVFNKVRRIGGFDLVIVDEAHMIPRKSDTSYGRFLRDLREATPDMRVLGLTATPYRLDSGRLDTGDEKLFDKIVYEANVADLIEEGFLCPLVSKATDNEFDVSGVAVRGGEFVAGALQERIDRDWLVRAAVGELVAAGVERRAWLVFCAGVDHALHVRDAIRAHGVECESVTGDMPGGERERVIRAFVEGRIRCLTNANVLTTGFNAPHVDLIGLMRPTKSTGLYVQMVGRGFRNAPGKSDALILDWAGLVRQHGPVDAIDVADRRPPGEGGGESRAKECPSCKTLVGLAARSCPTCGHEYTPPEEKPKHAARADVSRILQRGAPDTQWLQVRTTSFARHQKPGAPVSLRVTHQCGFAEHSEWWCFEHGGYAAEKARHLWRAASTSSAQPPKTVDEALARTSELLLPVEISVKRNGKYHEIVGRRLQKKRRAA